MHLHSLPNRTEQLAKGSPFYLFIYLVQINYIFSNNLCILSIYYISYLRSTHWFGSRTTQCHSSLSFNFMLHFYWSIKYIHCISIDFDIVFCNSYYISYVLRVQRSLCISYFKGLFTCGKNKTNIFRIVSVVRYSKHSALVYLLKCGSPLQSSVCFSVNLVLLVMWVMVSILSVENRKQ